VTSPSQGSTASRHTMPPTLHSRETKEQTQTGTAGTQASMFAAIDASRYAGEGTTLTPQLSRCG
jgi:hypothetical protein